MQTIAGMGSAVEKRFQERKIRPRATGKVVPTTTRIQTIKKITVSEGKSNGSHNCTATGKQKKLQADSSSPEAKMAMETKAKQRATRQEVWLPSRAQDVGAKLLRTGQFEQPHTALTEVWHGPPFIGAWRKTCPTPHHSACTKLPCQARPVPHAQPLLHNLRQARPGRGRNSVGPKSGVGS